MGHATALEFAVHGYDVNLIDLSDQALAKGMDLIRRDLDELYQHGLLMKEETRDDVLERFSLFTDLAAGVKDADYITESVAENLEVKKDLWKAVEEAAAADAIFTTNTSGLSPTAIADVLEKPDRFVVAHYWNPAHLMPLVEVVPGRYTSEQTVNTTVDLLTAIGKKPARLHRESPGFVGNRIQMAVIREALHIVEEGIASVEDVDTIVTYSLGRRWNILGPIISADLGGLDIFYKISTYLPQDLDNSTEPNKLLADKVAEGDLGSKSGQGFYRWTGQKGAETIARRDEELMKALVSDRQEEE
ncbi:3-hydroxybutyryl-CoA dehydrogenase [Scardovia inopinata JCM 12537]|nr:3-hydroxybutyryl-CoA dehydrogenase [Scardovia inopinata JCM 12537]